MNGFHFFHKQRGISLIEALIAITVLSLGMLSIAKFQGDLTASSGTTKARAEAIKLAQDKIEELRNLILRAQYDAVADGDDNPVGTNTVFDREWTVTPSGSRMMQIAVTVSWDDPRGESQAVGLSSIIAWDDPALSAGFASGEASGGGFIKPPTGRAYMEGDKTYGPGGIPGDAVSNLDGTYTYVTEDGDRELIDGSTGDVLMVIPGGSEDDFSTLSGKLYFDWAVSGQAPNPNAFFIMTSDAAYCFLLDDTLVSLPTTGSAKYKYYNYKCYVGPEWYGNVGVVSTDRTNNQNRVCVGDPTKDVTYTVDDNGLQAVSSYNLAPALSTIRIYRGYEDIGGVMLVSSGIGMVSGNYTDVHYSDHDFLVTRITGQAADAQCKSPMENISPSPFVGNAGKFVCLSATCPEYLPTGDVPTTTFTGEITDFNGNNSNLPTGLALDITAGTCSLTRQNNNAPYRYTCEISWLGWTGGTWQGQMTVDGTGADVCTLSPVAPVGITPIDAEGNTLTWDQVIYLDDASLDGTDAALSDEGDVDYQSIGFIDFPPEVIEMTIDFTVRPTGTGAACRP